MIDKDTLKQAQWYKANSNLTLRQARNLLVQVKEQIKNSEAAK